MSAIAKNTENPLADVAIDELANIANNAAKNAEDGMAAAVRNAITAGNALTAAKAQCKHGDWLRWLKENWGFSRQLAHRFMKLANDNRSCNLESAESVNNALRILSDSVSCNGEQSDPPLLNVSTGEPVTDGDVDVVCDQQAFTCETCHEQFDNPVWHCVKCEKHWTENIESCDYCDTIADHAEKEPFDVIDEVGSRISRSEEPIDADGPGFYSVDQWAIAKESDVVWESPKTFNRQDTSSIEWAKWSWNPITGCKHDCPYCYARDIANRFYEQKFEPSIYPSRFAAPENTRVPDRASEDTSYRNVFTGSMADIFGRWVPEDWVEMVLAEVKRAPQWNFLFLTKFPQRVHEFGELPENAWMGTTVDCQDRVDNAEKAFAKMGGGIKWLSVEPMLTPIQFSNLEMFDWVVIGGASRSSTTPGWVPPIDWVVDLHKQARDSKCAIYHKDNLQLGDELRLREFPWEESEPRQLPEELKYLGIK